MTTSRAGTLKTRSKQAAKRLLNYESRNRLRIRQIEAFTTFHEAADRKARDVIDISPGWNRYWKAMCPQLSLGSTVANQPQRPPLPSRTIFRPWLG